MTLLSTSAQAVVNGIVPSTAPGAPAIVNPFTGQSTDAWKLVGYLGCSGFQISREWVMHAGHCAINANTTGTFRSHLGSSPVLGTDCYRQGAYDFQICRLQNPAALAAPSSYPALVALPVAWRDSAKATKYGSLMGYGHATAGDGLAFVGMDGFPFGFNPAAPGLTPLPYTSSGDSGGAVYWFPPASDTPYLTGVLVVAGTVATSPLYLNADNLAFIKSTIESRGDVAPAMPALNLVYTPPAGDPPPELAAVPVVARSGFTNNITLRWGTPAASPTVSRFQVSLGREGAIERSLSVTAGTSNNQLGLTLNPAKYTLCVRPENVIGASRPARPSIFGWTAPNCTAYDNRDNQATITGLTHTGNKAVSTQMGVGFAWASTPAPVDLALSGYRVTQSVSYPSGPSRTSTTTVSTPAVSITTVRGSRVCVSVAALAVNGKLGTTSSAVCAVAN